MAVSLTKAVAPTVIGHAPNEREARVAATYAELKRCQLFAVRFTAMKRARLATMAVAA